MNNRKTTRGRKRLTQIIEKFKDVPCPIFGHPSNSVPNIGSQYSTHYYQNKALSIKTPYTINKLVSRKHIIHRNY